MKAARPEPERAAEPERILPEHPSPASADPSRNGESLGRRTVRLLFGRNPGGEAVGKKYPGRQGGLRAVPQTGRKDDEQPGSVHGLSEYVNMDSLAPAVYVYRFLMTEGT